MKKWILISLVFFSLGCQIKSHRAGPGGAAGEGPSTEDSRPVEGEPYETSPLETYEPVKKPGIKLGVILGPGGARAFAHIGFLKQLQAKRVHVHGIVGLEWGALVAASFAAKGSAHEAEWQLSKMKGLEKSWFSNGGSDARKVLSPLEAYLSSYKAESLKIPFGCPSLNLKKSQVFMMARGRLDQLLPFCMSYPPHLRPYNRTIAAVREVESAVDYLRKQGATHIVFVNVINKLGPDEPVNWLELSFDLRRKWPGVHEKLDIVISRRSTTDFEFRQEMIESGMEQSEKIADSLAAKL